MIEITVTRPGEATRKERFEASKVTIGRDADCDLVLDSPGCSRRHAEVLGEGGSWRIVDLGSTNGLLHGSERVREVALRNGVEVMIGEHRLTFSVPDPAAAERTVLLDYSKLAPEMVAGPPDRSRPSPTPPPPVLYLVWRVGSQDLSLKLVGGTDYVLGRSPSADLVLEDPESSVQHAVVTARSGRFYIRDLGSSNGTELNGKPVTESPLGPGDEIQIGQTCLRAQADILDLDDQGLLLGRTLKPRPAAGPAEEVSGDLERRSGDSRRDLWVALGVVVVLVTVAAAFFLGRRTKPGEAETSVTPAASEKRVEVAPAVISELVFEVSGSGSVRAHRTATLSAEVPGRVEELAASEGTGVEPGALLVRLDGHDIEHQIEVAKASISREQVELAKTDYERKERLFHEDAVVRSVYDEAKNRYLSLDSAYKSAQARIKQLREQLAKTSIRAPMSGVVVKTFVNPGELVAPGVPVVALENLEKVLVKVDLADRDFVGVRLGQPVEATTDAFPGRVFRGEITRLGSAANPVTRTFEVEASLLNTDFSLRSGMIVWLRIIQGKAKGLVVPKDALIEQTEGRGELFVVRGGVARLLEVRLGHQRDRWIQVFDGVSEGDEVVVFGQDGLADGQSVETYRKQ